MCVHVCAHLKEHPQNTYRVIYRSTIFITRFSPSFLCPSPHHLCISAPNTHTHSNRCTHTHTQTDAQTHTSSASFGSALSFVLRASTFSVSHSKMWATSSGRTLSMSSKDSSLCVVVCRCVFVHVRKCVGVCVHERKCVGVCVQVFMNV